MLAYLGSRRVSPERIRRKMALLAPGRDFDSMTTREVIHTLGVAGVAELAGVTKPMVLQAAGPEACAVADLIEPSAYGYFPSVGRRYPDAAPMLQAPGGGYIEPRAPEASGIYIAPPDYGTRPAPYIPPSFADVAPPASSAPAYTPELVSSQGQLTYVAPSAAGSYTYQAPEALPRTYTAPAEVAAAPVYAASSVPQSYGTTQTGTTYYSAPAPSVRQPLRRSMGSMLMRNPPTTLTPAQEAFNAAFEAGATADQLAAISGTFEPAPATISGWPGAVPFRPDAWNFDTGVYTLQEGDTFSGLSSTYLQSPARYMEIWVLQPYRYTKAIDPSSVTSTRPIVRVGELVIMPDEATERAKELVRTGAPTAPAIGGPGAVGAPWTGKKKLAVGLAVLAGVAVVGGGVYLAR
jgi:hypothetical protein